MRADSKNEFPIDIKEYVPTPSGNISQVYRLLAEYDENRIDSGDQPLTRFQKNFLIKVVDVTKLFRKPMHLKIVFNQVKSEKNYTFQTMRKFLFELSRLIEYCKCYKQKEYRFNPGLITGELKTLLRNTAKKSAKEVNTRMIKRFDKVPNLYQVAHLRQMVKELLQNHPQEAFTYVEYLSLLVFLVHSESNCRIGALLQLSKEDFDEMKNKKVLTTFEHKTGSNFPNFIRITDDNRKWIEDLHDKFVEERGAEPKLAFPSPSNKKFTCQAKYLKETIKRFFAIDDKLYNPDNVRKAWDSYRTKTNFVDGTDAILYQLNTGHSETTRNKYYLKPATDDEIEKFLDKQLNLIDDPENCYVADDEPPKPLPEVQDDEERVQEESDQEEDENDERCNEEIHGGDAQTPNSAQEKNTEDSDKENSLDETLSLENNDSFPNIDEYEPPKKSKKKNRPKEEPIDSLAEKAKTWAEVRVKLLRFKGPEDKLRKQLIALFHQVCDRMRYIPREELKEMAKAQGATEKEASILAEKAVKKSVTS